MQSGIINSWIEALTGPASYILLILVNTIMVPISDDRYPADYRSQLRDGDAFDFIVIGAGSAGSVVANRLSENSDWKVLLVEAGTYPSVTSEIPALATVMENTYEDWKYETEPSRGLRHNRKGRCPRGKGIGGSSLLNYMVYLRGNRHDYDNWANAGNDGWDYDTVLQHFKSFEDLQEDTTNSVFPKGGELKISKEATDEPIMQSLIDGYNSLGYSNDYNEERPLGFFHHLRTISDGTRSSTGKAFLSTIKERGNLFVVVNAQASKLLLNVKALTTEGVEIRLNDKQLKIIAKKEVILSAGAINTPQILMNSGIGPATHLQSLGIEVIRNLRVGENLQDHFVFSGLFFNVNKPSLHFKAPIQRIGDLYQYFLRKKGPFATSGISSLVGFVNPNNFTEYPSLQFMHLLHYQKFLSIPLVESGYRTAGLPENILKLYQKNNKKKHNLQFVLAGTYPKSRGKILLRSDNPFDKPLIVSNYLTDESNEDVATLIEGIRVVQRLVKTKELQKLNPQLVPLDLPDCQTLTFDTNEYWDCAIRNLVVTNYHWVGSCKMGLKSDPDAVVDSRLRVQGVKGVRVVDGSIMPTIVGTNTNGPIIMIGEKGSKMIIEDWKTRHGKLIY